MDADIKGEHEPSTSPLGFLTAQSQLHNLNWRLPVCAVAKCAKERNYPPGQARLSRVLP
jgi:hypothetical protein